MKPDQAIKVYAHPNHGLPSCEENLNPILQALWCSSRSDEKPPEYRSRNESFVSVSKAADANLILLCCKWNYYLDHGLVSLALKEAADARKANKPFVVFSYGDSTANLPFTDATLFQSSGYRSRRTTGGGNIHALPSFIPDYQSLYAKGSEDYRQKAARPIVGFCGQAGGSLLDVVRRGLACHWRKCAFRFHLRNWEPPPFETVRWRQRVLDHLARDPRVETHFIIRRRYRAGYWAKKKDPFHATRLEMVDNMRNTNYTVCMRGGGNFSVRLYETLCLGRIPVFVDTDCTLPYDNVVDWKRYCVWVDSAEIQNISSTVIEFHDALNHDEFISRQQECRRFWMDWLSTEGFWHKFSHFFSSHP